MLTWPVSAQSVVRQGLIVFVFFWLCLGLGYSVIFRLDPGTVPGLSDAALYAQMSVGEGESVRAPWRFRVLVPALAGSLQDHVLPETVGNWNVNGLAFLIVNSLLIAIGTTILIAIGVELGIPAGAAAVGGLLYLTAFPIPNSALLGLVDSAELLTICSIVLLSLRELWWFIPLAIVIGTVGKETTALLGSVWMVAIWLFPILPVFPAASGRKFPRPPIAVVIVTLIGAVSCVAIIRALVGGPIAEGHTLSLDRLLESIISLPRILVTKSMIYTSMILLPLSAMQMRKVPAGFIFGSLAMASTVWLAASYSAIGENIFRPLFTVLAPLMCLTAGLGLMKLIESGSAKLSNTQSTGK